MPDTLASPNQAPATLHAQFLNATYLAAQASVQATGVLLIVVDGRAPGQIVHDLRRGRERLAEGLAQADRALEMLEAGQ